MRPSRPVAPASTGMPNALDLLKALRHRWVLAVTLGVVFAAAAAGACLKILPAPEYSAQALLLVAGQQPHIIFETGEAQANFATYQQTELTLLKSHTILNAALNDESVTPLQLDERYPDPIAWLEEKIQANYKGEVLRIAMTGPNPNEVAVLVNAVSDAYLREHLNKTETERRAHHEQLKDIYTDYQKRLESKRKELKALSEQLGSNDRETIQFSEQLLLERRELALQDLATLGREIERLRIQIAVREESPSGSKPMARHGSSLPIEAQVAENPTIAQYDAEIASRVDRLQQQQRLIRRPSDPAIRRLEQDISRLQEAREEYATQLRMQLAQQSQSVGSTAGHNDVNVMKEQLRVLEELEHLARTRVEGMNVERQQINQDTWMLDQVRDELEQIDAKATRIGSEVEALNVELNAPERVRLAEKAENPRLQDDKRPKMAGMAGMGAFGMALLGVAFLEYRTRRIHTVDAIMGELQLRLVGALPALPARRRQAAFAEEESSTRWRSMLLESVDAMRTLLLRASATDSVRSVMITSAVAAEGKTSLASHLATSLARAGRRTLLVDCDLRKPDVHRLFDIAEAPGLSEFLRGEADVEAAIHPSPAVDLWIMPAGAVDERSIQALSQPRAEAVFRQLREQFDFVVVDTAPVIPVADALLVGQNVDGAIYSVLRSASRVPKVQAAVDRLRSVGIPIFGAVMTGVQGDLYGSQYAYSYSYGSGASGSTTSQGAASAG
ncbi:polysaccharide biosynthesis tyrosine autokinase [Tautonia rosea]|uniref:polysaccharide biosynthesis tyrosine autokinase n=1 Tax=Tautonia rosea TaxID=2728037 RepID=UPI0014737CC5|nr:polysaccharide biosynthesis tyrosine autokinase [Tautonia rosea]